MIRRALAALLALGALPLHTGDLAIAVTDAADGDQGRGRECHQADIVL